MSDRSQCPGTVCWPVSTEALRVRVLESVILGYSLIAGAFYSNPPSSDEPEGWARLVIGVLAGMLALSVRDRRAAREDRSPHAMIFDLLVVYGSVIGSQMLMYLLRPALMLPQWAPTQGGFVGIMLFSATRALLPATAGGDRSLLISGPDSEPQTDRAYSRLHVVYGIAGLIGVGVGSISFAASSTRLRIASCFVVLGSGFLLSRILPARRGDSERLGGWGRVQAGVRLSQAAAVWYYGALFPASLLALFGAKVYLYWVPIVILMFAEVNLRTLAAYSGCLHREEACGSSATRNRST